MRDDGMCQSMTMKSQTFRSEYRLVSLVLDFRTARSTRSSLQAPSSPPNQTRYFPSCSSKPPQPPTSSPIAIVSASFPEAFPCIPCTRPSANPDVYVSSAPPKSAEIDTNSSHNLGRLNFLPLVFHLPLAQADWQWIVAPRHLIKLNLG